VSNIRVSRYLPNIFKKFQQIQPNMFQTIEIPSMKVTKKVKSIQMFRKPVDKIVQVGLLWISLHAGGIIVNITKCRWDKCEYH